MSSAPRPRQHIIWPSLTSLRKPSHFSQRLCAYYTIIINCNAAITCKGFSTLLLTLERCLTRMLGWVRSVTRYSVNYMSIFLFFVFILYMFVYMDVLFMSVWGFMCMCVFVCFLWVCVCNQVCVCYCAFTSKQKEEKKK